MRALGRMMLLAVTLVTVAACGSPSRTGATGATGQRVNPDVISQAELTAVTGVTARQAIERLRPRFLRTRGQTSVNLAEDRVQVYLDNTRLGGPEVLEQIQVSELAEIRYFSGPDATNRFGIGHSNGAIVMRRR